MTDDPGPPGPFPPLQPEQIPGDPDETHAYLARLESVMLQSILDWLEKLEPLEGYKWATTLHRVYWESGYRLAAIRARFAAEALEQSGESMRSFAPQLGINYARLAQLVREHEGRKRAPRAAKAKATATGGVGSKRRAPGPLDETVPLSEELRRRLEEVGRQTGNAPDELILLAITSMLDQLEEKNERVPQDEGGPST